MRETVLPLVFAMASVATGLAEASAVWMRAGGGSPPTRTITICKRTKPVVGTSFPFTWSNGFGSLPSFSLTDNQCITKDVTNQDHYNKYTENVPAGWTLTSIKCTYTTSLVRIIGANAHPGFQPGDNTVTIDINEPNVQCIFGNVQSAQPCLRPPPPGMASWWTGDGVATDHVGGTGGTIVGNVTYAPGKVAQAFKITQGYVEVPDNPLHIPSGSFTVDAWIQQTGQFGPYYVVSKYECGGFCGNPNPAYSTYQLRVLHTRAQAVIRDSDGAGSGVSQTLIGPHVVNGQWHHLAMVRDVAAGTLSLYVDGALAASTPLNAGTNGPLHDDDHAPDALYIGAIKRAGNSYAAGGVANMEGFFLGMIDEVEYFNRALAPGEIASIFNAGSGGKCK